MNDRTTNGELDVHAFRRRYELVAPLLREVGRWIRAQRAAGTVRTLIKPDGSPVTNCDLEADRRICDALSRHFPDEPVVSEEAEDKRYPVGTERLWYVDPIDGTNSFVRGEVGYFVMLGFCLRGVPVFGILYQPETDRTLAGWTGQAPFFVDGELESFAPEPAPHSKQRSARAARRWLETESLTLEDTPPVLGARLSAVYGIARAAERRDIVEMVGALYGHGNGFISYRATAHWDFCAPAALMHAAGFRTAAEHPTHPVLFNDGSLESTRYHCLPPDTPEEVVRMVVGT